MLKKSQNPKITGVASKRGEKEPGFSVLSMSDCDRGQKGTWILKRRAKRNLDEQGAKPIGSQKEPGGLCEEYKSNGLYEFYY